MNHGMRGPSYRLSVTKLLSIYRSSDILLPNNHYFLYIVFKYDMKYFTNGKKVYHTRQVLWLLLLHMLFKSFQPFIGKDKNITYSHHVLRIFAKNGWFAGSLWCSYSIFFCKKHYDCSQLDFVINVILLCN